MQQFTYADDWYPATDGTGFSLEVVNVNGALAEWSTKAGWRASGTLGGSPGTTDASGPLPGDSNMDGIFDSSDFVIVFQAGEYEDNTPGNSTFEEGDWNGDGDFDTTDFVFVFQLGHYSRAAKGLVRDDTRVLARLTSETPGRADEEKAESDSGVELPIDRQEIRFQDAAIAELFSEENDRTLAFDSEDDSENDDLLI